MAIWDLETLHSQSSFPIIVFIQNMENQYADFLTCRQIVNICRISLEFIVKT